MLHYEEKKIENCLRAIEGISLQGTENMMKLLYIKQELSRPDREEDREEKEDGDGC